MCVCVCSIILRIEVDYPDCYNAKNWDDRMTDNDDHILQILTQPFLCTIHPRYAMYPNCKYSI